MAECKECGNIELDGMEAMRRCATSMPRGKKKPKSAKKMLRRMRN